MGAEPVRTDRHDLHLPVRGKFPITPHDTNELARIARGLYVGGGGDIACVLADDTASHVLAGVAGGYWHPILVRKVLATGTTATGLFGGI